LDLTYGASDEYFKSQALGVSSVEEEMEVEEDEEGGVYSEEDDEDEGEEDARGQINRLVQMLFGQARSVMVEIVLTYLAICGCDRTITFTQKYATMDNTHICRMCICYICIFNLLT